MDTSEQYIKMCQKARAIQAAWKPAEGDFSYGDTMASATESAGMDILTDGTLIGDGTRGAGLTRPLPLYPERSDTWQDRDLHRRLMRP